MKTLSFPFYFVCAWIKLCPQGQQCCKCSNEAAFVHEDYTDTSSLRNALESFETFQAGIDTIWAKTIQAQMQGTYTKYRDMHHCRDCTCRIVARWSNEMVADVSLSTMQEAKIAGLVLGCRVKSLQDNGDSLVMAVKAKTIEDLAEHLRGKVVSMRL
jgi:hypothetical protein